MGININQLKANARAAQANTPTPVPTPATPANGYGQSNTYVPVASNNPYGQQPSAPIQPSAPAQPTAPRYPQPQPYTQPAAYNPPPPYAPQNPALPANTALDPATGTLMAYPSNIECPKVSQLSAAERQYAAQTLLHNREYWIATDESASMNSQDVRLPQGLVSRHEALGERAMAITTTANSYDSNGLTWIRFGDAVTVEDNVKPNRVAEAFQAYPRGNSTNLVGMLKAFRKGVIDQVDDALRRGQTPKPHSLLVFTDGVPTAYGRTTRQLQTECRNTVKALCQDLIKRRLDDQFVAISFIQIGMDEDAADFLNELDDGLKDELNGFDIVDTKHWDVIRDYRLSDVDLLVDGILD